MPSKAFEAYGESMTLVILCFLDSSVTRILISNQTDNNYSTSQNSSNVSLANDGFIALLQRDDSAISGFLETATRNTTEHDFMLGLDVCSRDFYNENEVTEMKSKVANLQKAAEVLLSDARPEISDVTEVMQQFAAFRRRFPKKYASAFVPLSLPPLIGALVRFDVIVYPMLMENVSGLNSHRTKLSYDCFDVAYIDRFR